MPDPTTPNVNPYPTPGPAPSNVPPVPPQPTPNPTPSPAPPIPPTPPTPEVPPLQPLRTPTPPPVNPTPPPPPSYEPAVEGSGGGKLKIFLIIFLLAVILGGLFFIFKPSLPFALPFFGGSSGPVTLKYWGLWESEAVLKPLIEEYQALHPDVTIQYEKRSPTQYRESLLSRLTEGVGPDIFRIHNTWYPMVKDELAEVPSNVYSASEMTATFYPTVTADLSSGGKYYAVPLMFDGLALLYNDEMFKAAGLASPPQTWSDVRNTYAPKLTQYDKDGNVTVGGIALGTSTNVDNFSDILGLLMLQNGTKMIEGNQVTFHKSIASGGNNTGADALDFYTKFAKNDFSDKGAVWSDTLPSSVEAFATGKVAMILVPSYRIFDVLNLMAQSGSTFTVKVTQTPQPLPEGQQTPVHWATYWAEAVSKRSQNQARAWDFLKFLSSKDSIRKLYTEQAKTRPFGEIPSRVDVADALLVDRYVASYLQGAKFAKSWYLASGTSDRGINDQIITYFGDAVTSVLKKGVSPAQALEVAASGASQVLARYGLVQTSAAGAGSQ